MDDSDLRKILTHDPLAQADLRDLTLKVSARVLYMGDHSDWTAAIDVNGTKRLLGKGTTRGQALASVTAKLERYIEKRVIDL